MKGAHVASVIEDMMGKTFIHLREIFIKIYIPRGMHRKCRKEGNGYVKDQ